VELLPSTPTFLRMLLLKKSIKKIMPKCLKIITYGTEMMDEHTLKNLNKYFPKINFRQTYGMSELGIMRVKSRSNKSLFMKVGGEGIKLKTKNNILYIKSKNRMLAYLNHPTPFDKDGWYNTRDVVEKKNDYIKIVGRSDNIINVSGIKFFASEIESRILKFPGVRFANVYGKKNPITGQHVILKVDINNLIFNHKKFKKFIREKLPQYMVPSKIIFDKIKISPRLKKEIKED
jgi:acyl-coenzyme A synthetase/AMP-(fatty) acid ligase